MFQLSLRVCVAVVVVEGAGLANMANGLVNRYEQSSQPPPVLLYVDCDCCSDATRRLFQPWQDLQIRLDIWLFIRRFASCCTNESHPMYKLFVSKLSACIIQWQSTDVPALYCAKLAKLAEKSASGLINADMLWKVSRNKLALQCHRTTKHTKETTRMLEELIACFYSDHKFGPP